MARKSSRHRIPTHLVWLASLLFFVSGGTGLVYQVIWFKRFAHVWGSSSLAFAAVGGSFLFGLGLGAYLLGRRADAVSFPLRWYGVCELLIGLWALIIPFEIAALVAASGGLYAAIPEQPLLRYLVQFGVTLLVIGPPCVLMGGTLPLLIRQLTDRDGSLDQATGWLYAVNTLGGAGGCYLAGFHLLPSMGMLTTNYLTAAVNLAIGAVSVLASGSAARVDVSAAPALSASAARTSLGSGPRLIALYMAAAFSGCAALILEMTWSRQLALVLGGSTYAYTSTLFVVLLGIASGSLIFHFLLRRWASRAWLSLAVVGTLVVGTLAGIWLLPWISLQVAPLDVRLARGDLLMNGLICVGASCLVELLPAVGMGILFPLFVHLTQATAARVGAAVGNIYACNTAGSILGATFTAVLLFPRLGTAGAAALAVAMYVVTLLAMLPWEGRASLVRLGVSASAGAAAVALVAWPGDPRATNLGFGLYGYPGEGWFNANEVLFFEEGASSNVLVAKVTPNLLNLRVNGKVDASNGGDMATQVGLAYLPRIFKPDAKEILVIGFGSGCTPGHSLQFPDTHVTCCELEPAVYAAARHFKLINRRPHEQTRAWLEARNAELPSAERLSPEEIDKRARFAIVFGDGRTAIQASSKKYDLIISEPSNPWVAGCSNLFTQEFFHAARERLSDDGVLAQWIQTYNFTLENYLLIVRTMRSEFPHYGVITLSGGSDTLLLASSKPLMPEPDKLAALQEQVDRDPLVKADLDAWFGQSDLRWLLLRHYMAGKEQLDRAVASVPSKAINTDVNLRLEFDAPLQLYKPADPAQQAMTALPKAIEKDRATWVSSLARRMGLAGGTPEFFVALGDQTLTQAAKYEIASMQRGAVYASHVQNALPWYAIALKLQPDNAAARRGQRRAQLMLDEKTDRSQILQELVKLDPSDAEARAQLATWYLGKRERKRAVAEYEEALRLRPELSFSTRNYTWANNLAWILATSPEDDVRNGPEAVRWAQAAYDVAGHADWDMLDTLSVALAENGQFAEAIEATQRLIEHFSDDPKLVEGFKQRLALYRASKPYHESS